MNLGNHTVRPTTPTSRPTVFTAFVTTLAAILVLAARPSLSWAQADHAEVHELTRAWVDASAEALRAAPVGAVLPPGAVLDRAETRENAAAAYLTLPASYLASLTEEECERVIASHVGALRGAEGVRSFMVFARPAGENGAAYRPLPAYLPARTGPRDKPEDTTGQPVLRDGGLPVYNPGKPQGALTGKTVFLSPGHGWYYSSTLGRWATQRGNNGGIIEDLSNGEAVMQHLTQYLHNAGANVWTCRERDFNTHMVIVDNDAGAPAYTTSGAWSDGTAAGNWYGSDYQFTGVSTSETAVATYAPNIPEAGYYAVYVWTPSAANRATDATVRVNHTGGTTTHVINMQHDGNTWRLLGFYYFNAGRDQANGSVEISNAGSDTSKYVIADAVRFGGGMGDYPDGGSVSGWPRWEESGAYYPIFMGQRSTPGGTVGAMPQYAEWESESWEDSIYFSWHSNASTGSGHGTSLWAYGPGSPPSPFGQFSGVAGGDTLATSIFDEVMNDIRADWDPVWPGAKYTAWFGELNPSNNDEMPACLIEVAYHDSPADQPSLLDPRFRDLVARACYQGIVDWWYNHADGPSSTPIAINTLLPEPPTRLAVRNIGDQSVFVNWSAPPSDGGDGLLGDPATGYLVQMSRDGYGFDDGTPTTSTFMTFTDLDVGDVYYFRVVATNAGGQSFPTEIGAVRVTEDGYAPLLVVNGFDRLDRYAMLAEDDPYDADPMMRERPQRMNHYAYSRTYAAAIDANGVAFDYCANEAARSGAVNLTNYDGVVWYCGEESTTLSTFDATEQSRVTTFLAGGGRLFVSGAEIGWDLDQAANGVSFYNNQLKANYVADDAGTYLAAGVAGGLFDGIAAFAFDDGSTIYDVDYPDVISPLGGATAAVSYVGGTGGTAGVVYDGAYKLVHLAFPFEAIVDANVRTAVMGRVLAFFDFDPQQPPQPPADIIIEARDPSGVVTPAPAYVETGAWANSSIKSSASGLVGTGSRFITYDLPNAGTDHAAFVPDILVPGRYEIFVTWANGANCYDARYRVRHYFGNTDQLVDQISAGAPEPANYDTWISLGAYWFTAGQGLANASIDVSEETVTGKPSPNWNQRVYADAVKLVFVAWWPNGDGDADGDVDLLDFAGFIDCVTGVDVAYSDPDCVPFDFELDGDVDLRDFFAMQQAFAPAD